MVIRLLAVILRRSPGFVITNHASDNLQTSPKQEELRKSEKEKHSNKYQQWQ